MKISKEFLNIHCVYEDTYGNLNYILGLNDWANVKLYENYYVYVSNIKSMTRNVVFQA